MKTNFRLVQGLMAISLSAAVLFNGLVPLNKANAEGAGDPAPVIQPVGHAERQEDFI